MYVERLGGPWVPAAAVLCITLVSLRGRTAQQPPAAMHVHKAISSFADTVRFSAATCLAVIPHPRLGHTSACTTKMWRL